MAITSEIIGKLGGADVEVIPVEGEASGGRGSSAVLATIDVPAGETWLVAAIGQTVPASPSSKDRPGLYLGDEISIEAPAGMNGLATTATGSINFSIKRSYSLDTDTFTGHVYTVKM